MKADQTNCIRFSIPAQTAYNFQGEGMFEETLEDHFCAIISAELLHKNVPFNIDYNDFEVTDGFGIALRYNGEDCINLKKVIQQLFKSKFRLGLIVQKLTHGYWTEIYNDAKRTQYREFEEV